MKINYRKLPLGVCVALVFIAGAVSYAVGYNIAMKKFNDVVSYVQERRRFYSKLSEIDTAIRQDYLFDLNEESIMEGVCSGYLEGVGEDGSRYFTEEQYKEFLDKKSQRTENTSSYDLLNDEVGYIRIRSLGAGAGDAFSSSLLEVIGLGAGSLVLDLRNCEDGAIDEAKKCLNELIPESDVIFSIDKKGKKETVFRTNGSGLDIKISVIVDERTSGPAEIIASALKDSGKAVLVGGNTKGRAVEEKYVRLSDGSSIAFPYLHYATQSGTVFYGRGLEPDVKIDADQEKIELFNAGELDYSEDEILKEAVGRVV